MATLILEPGNPHDFTEEDERELVLLLKTAAPEDDVRVARRPEEGYGVTLEEVVHVFVEHPELAEACAPALAALLAWLGRRFRRDGRRRTVPIYGADGRILKTVRIDVPDGEPVEKASDAKSRQPPDLQAP